MRAVFYYLEITPFVEITILRNRSYAKLRLELSYDGGVIFSMGVALLLYRVHLFGKG